MSKLGSTVDVKGSSSSASTEIVGGTAAAVVPPHVCRSVACASRAGHIRPAANVVYQPRCAKCLVPLALDNITMALRFFHCVDCADYYVHAVCFNRKTDPHAHHLLTCISEPGELL